jgi:hypothetical protein
LGLQSMPPTARETLDSMTLRLGDGSLEEVRYWGDESVGRIEFVTMIRCRLRTAWSLQAKVMFWAVFGFELLVIGFAGRWNPWLWSFLLTMPLLAWLLTREKQKLQSMMVVFLDEVAKGWKMLKVPEPEEKAAVENRNMQTAKAE